MVMVESVNIESTHLVEVMPVVNIITESTIKNSTLIFSSLNHQLTTFSRVAIKAISVKQEWGIIIYEKINFTVQPLI